MYISLIRYQDEVTNITVLNDGDCFQLASLDGSASDPFATLNDLLTYCMESPTAIPLKDGGYIQLKTPLASEDPTSERLVPDCCCFEQLLLISCRRFLH